MTKLLFDHKPLNLLRMAYVGTFSISHKTSLYNGGSTPFRLIPIRLIPFRLIPIRLITLYWRK